MLAFSLSVWLALPATAQEPAILQIRVLEGDGAVYGTGSRAVRGLTVQVTDETGRPVEGVIVNFHLPEDGPTGLFSTGSKSEIVTTSADGRAAVWGMRWNHTPGPVQVRVTAVKGMTRAGTVTSVYLSESVAASAGQPRAVAGSHGRWLLIGVLVAGAAAGGVVAGLSRGGKAATAATTTAPSISIGTPTIHVGQP